MKIPGSQINNVNIIRFPKIISWVSKLYFAKFEIPVLNLLAIYEKQIADRGVIATVKF
jgi:hypothetical protein